MQSKLLHDSLTVFSLQVFLECMYACMNVFILYRSTSLISDGPPPLPALSLCVPPLWYSVCSFYADWGLRLVAVRWIHDAARGYCFYVDSNFDGSGPRIRWEWVVWLQWFVYAFILFIQQPSSLSSWGVTIHPTQHTRTRTRTRNKTPSRSFFFSEYKPCSLLTCVSFLAAWLPCVKGALVGIAISVFHFGSDDGWNDLKSVPMAVAL